MKLTYRGVSYEYTPQPVPKLGLAIAIGNYRGAAVELRTLAAVPAQPSHELNWRGVRYSSGKTAVSGVAPVAELAVQESVVQESINAGPETAIAVPAAAVAAAPTAPAVPVAQPAVALSTPDRARSLLMRHHQRIRRREQAMLARLDVEVGLTAADAARYEGHIQGKTLHGFAGYDRSSAAMS